nr:hypothetical protein [Tanacetum cinerariifolium]
MCLNSLGRSAYARVLIEIAADVELVKSLIIVIPVGNKEEHTFATIDIEYEWTPPRCASCRIFDHVSEKCPKLPKVASNEKVIEEGFIEVIEEGFIEVKKKNTKTKKKSKKQVEGVRLNKHTLNLQYQRVDKGKSSKINNGVANKESTRIIVRWNQNDVDVAVIRQEPQVIYARIWIKADRKEFFCSFVYAFNKYIHRRPLWNGLCLHKNYINNKPWCLLGGFNAPLFVEDTSMGSSSLDVTMREFKECVENMEVMDVQRTGLQYTLNQKPKGKDGILCKLDRVLANLEFLDVFMGAHAVFKPYRISDHSPAVLSIPSLVKVKLMPFKIFNVIILDDKFKDVVCNVWMAQISGFYMFRVVKKLKGLKKLIRKLMYDKGNLHANVVRLREELEKLKERDSNTAYFHKVLKSRVSRSRIDVVTDVYGNVHHSTEVAKAFINHYEIFLGQPGNTSDFNTDNLFPTNESEALNMVSDGFTAAFFKDTWDIIGVDVIKAVKEFFTNGRLLKELNHTVIALIPKVNTPARVTDYRPISCCNVLFKCISKIIANRLKVSLKRLVSPNQSAFVPGRCISDNILLTQEIMHNYHLDRGVSWCAFKVDIQKPYDTVDWDFYGINGSLHGYFEGKRGLRQGDPLSPYLFTLIMEVFMLMLKRRVSKTSTFTYHRFFSELDLINLCFADDLFLFAHGDANSAKVIKDALDDFKDASGLNPTLMVSHVWKLLALKESLWVKWIHVYKLKNRSFWDIPYRERLLCGLTSGVLRVLYLKSFHHETLLELVLTMLPRDGMGKPFSVHNVWNLIPPRDNPITWCDLVWFHACIPRHAFNMWLILKQQLRTQDCLRSWEIAGLTGAGPSLALIITHLLPIAKRKSSKSCIGKLVVAAAAYFIWHEQYGCEMTVTNRDDRYWHAMPGDYFFDVQPCKGFHTICLSGRDEMCEFGKAIDNDPDGVISV